MNVLSSHFSITSFGSTLYLCFFITLIGLITGYRWMKEPMPRGGLTFHFSLTLLVLIITASRSWYLYLQYLKPTLACYGQGVVEGIIFHALLGLWLSIILAIVSFLLWIKQRGRLSEKESVQRSHIPANKSLWSFLFSPKTFALTLGVHLLFLGFMIFAEVISNPAPNPVGNRCAALVMIPFSLQLIFSFLFHDLYWHITWLWEGPNAFVSWSTFCRCWLILLPLPASYLYALLGRWWFCADSSHLQSDAT